MWIVLDGSVATGYDFTGPFESSYEAQKWAEDNTGDWLIVKLEKPS